MNSNNMAARTAGCGIKIPPPDLQRSKLSFMLLLGYGWQGSCSSRIHTKPEHTLRHESRMNETAKIAQKD
jgi:hypothetical protein